MYGDDYDRLLDAMARRELQRIVGPDASLDDLLRSVVPPVTKG